MSGSRCRVCRRLGAVVKLPLPGINDLDYHFELAVGHHPRAHGAARLRGKHRAQPGGRRGLSPPRRFTTRSETSTTQQGCGCCPNQPRCRTSALTRLTSARPTPEHSSLRPVRWSTQRQAPQSRGARRRPTWQTDFDDLLHGLGAVITRADATASGRLVTRTAQWRMRRARSPPNIEESNRSQIVRRITQP